MSREERSIYRHFNLPGKVTVQVDTREQRPLLFPDTVFIQHPDKLYKVLPVQVEVQRIKVDAGDYRLAEYPKSCIIERKGGQLEIFKNLFNFKDSIRQAKSLRRLVTSCEYPFILIEAPLSEMFNPSHLPVKNPDLLLHQLSKVIAKYNLGLLYLPLTSKSTDMRRKAGTLILHIMLGCALRKCYEGCLPQNLIIDTIEDDNNKVDLPED